MKLLMVNYEFPPIGGGGANANAYLLKEYANHPGIEVDLVTSSISDDCIESLSDNIRIHRLDVKKKRLHYWTEVEVLRFLFRAIPYVKALLKTKKFDLCHAFFGFPSGYVAYRFRKELPYIISLRGSDVPGFNERFSLQYVFLTPLFRKIWNSAKSVIANSGELRSLALKTTPELPIDIIYNGIDADEFKPGEKKRDPGLSILTVSRLIPRKGIDYLIRALPDVVRRFPDLCLSIAGEGNMDEDLKALAAGLGLENNISFEGRVEHDRLPALYGSADIFILPSFWEGMSNTVLEAMASGLPLVVTDTGGTAELVKDNGIIIPKRDSKAISGALIKLIEDSDLRVKMGQESRSLALGLSWDKLALQYLDTYKRMPK